MGRPRRGLSKRGQFHNALYAGATLTVRLRLSLKARELAQSDSDRWAVPDSRVR